MRERPALAERASRQQAPRQAASASPLPSVSFRIRHDRRGSLRSGQPSRRRAQSDELDVTLEPTELHVAARLRPLVERQLNEAARHYAADRYLEAQRLLVRLERLAPGSPPIEELLGLVRYRLGAYAQAARHLEAFVSLTGDLNHGAILMDCARALGDHDSVVQWWRALREASPSKDALVEGRIVWSSHLAEQGDLTRAIAVVREGLARERSSRSLRQLRLRYQLANLLERAGRFAEAREELRRVATVDPTIYDVAERLAHLA